MITAKSEQIFNYLLCFIFRALFFYLTHSAYLKVTFFPYLKTSKQFYSLSILGINIIQCEGLLAWILAFQDQRQKL